MFPIKNPDNDPLWDSIGIRSCDFRPHFDGDLVNVWSCVFPEKTAEATRKMLEERTRKIARWILDNHRLFGKNDRFQIILGWPESLRSSSRQKVKVGGDAHTIATIATNNSPIPIRWETDPLMGENAPQ